MVHKMKNTIIISLILFYWNLSCSQTVVGLNMSSCEKNSYPEYIHDNRLISNELINDTLILKIGIVRNCDYSPKAQMSLRNDSLILELTNISEVSAMCDCCFELEIKAIGISDTNYNIYGIYRFSDITDKGFIEWTETSEIHTFKNKYLFPTNEEIQSYTEFNKLNDDGLKIGLWDFIEFGTKKVKAKIFYFIDDMGESRSSWYILYDKKGKFQEACALKSIDKNRISSFTCITEEQYFKIFNYKP